MDAPTRLDPGNLDPALTIASAPVALASPGRRHALSPPRPRAPCSPSATRRSPLSTGHRRQSSPCPCCLPSPRLLLANSLSPSVEERSPSSTGRAPRAQPPLRPPPRLSVAAAARALPDGSPSSLPAPRLPVTRVSSRWPRPAGHRSLADAPSSPLHTLARSPCRAGPAAPSPASDDSPRPPSSCVSLLCSLAWAAAAARPVVASQPRLCSETRIVKVIFENFRQVPRQSEPLGPPSSTTILETIELHANMSTTTDGYLRMDFVKFNDDP